jgi:hypothetical protein
MIGHQLVQRGRFLRGAAAGKQPPAVRRVLTREFQANAAIGAGGQNSEHVKGYRDAP